MALLILAPPASAGKDETVTISGRAYEFNHMDTYIEGATIRVREDPGLTAVTDANGDYELEVPRDTTVTPYIDPPAGYNEIDLQTFRARNRDIHNANFQTPADLEYNGLKALLGVESRPDGRPANCVIVTTASARNVRGVDYETFHERTPHGVAGATSSSQPPLPDPIYFNENVLPDPSQPSTSEDGGIIWTEVPAGTYRISTDSPDADFASFLATCEPGRVVNANPPWGAYQLLADEKPLRAGIAVGGIDRLSAGEGKVKAKVGAAEALDATIKLKRRGETLTTDEAALDPGTTRLRFSYPRSAAGSKVKLVLVLGDATGERAKSAEQVKLPR